MPIVISLFPPCIPWDITPAVYSNLSKTIAEESTPQGFAFSVDGTKMYVVGATNDTIYQYTLSTAWDISSATYDTVSLPISGQNTAPTGLAFKTDGTKMYVVGGTADEVNQYTLGTAWDLNTASFDSVVFPIAQDTFPQDIQFKPDGSKMYIIGNTNNSVYQYTLPTPWVLTGATYDGDSYVTTSEETTPTGLAFKPDGTKMYITGTNSGDVVQYTLGTAWDITSVSPDGVTIDVSNEQIQPTSLQFKSDGNAFYVLGANPDEAFQYTICS